MQKQCRERHLVCPGGRERMYGYSGCSIFQIIASVQYVSDTYIRCHVEILTCGLMV